MDSKYDWLLTIKGKKKHLYYYRNESPLIWSDLTYASWFDEINVCHLSNILSKIFGLNQYNRETIRFQVCGDIIQHNLLGLLKSRKIKKATPWERDLFCENKRNLMQIV